MRGSIRMHTGAAFLATLLAAPPAIAGELTVTIDGLTPDGRLTDRAAFCPVGTGTPTNVSPAIRWSAGPAGTRSYALVMSDGDVPADFSQMNRADKMIAADAPRITIHHWVLADIPATLMALDEGAESTGVVPHGKPVGPTGHGVRGANDYTSFLAGNPDMAGTYGGFDGPCPPDNDLLPHRYVVRVLALDVPTLGLTGAFGGPALLSAVKGHVLAEGEAMATFTRTPQLLAPPAEKQD